MKKAGLDKIQGKKLSDSASNRGGQGPALSKREQALARKRELLQKSRKSR